MTRGSGHVEGPIGLAPVRAADGDAGLVLTGEIRLDNRQELRARLALSVRLPASDAELVLGAYRRWGEDCAERLAGDFAFALWDGQRRSVFCARDGFGVMPFYYALSPGRFCFAADPAAVLRAAGVRREVDPAAVVAYLHGSYDDAASTLYRDVFRLPPGHALVVGPARRRRWRHWRLESVPELRLPTDADYEEAFRAELTRAVEARLAPGGVGVSLSGGLDSSSVTCLAQRAYEGGRVAAISAVFDEEPRSDERAYAAAAVAHAGAEGLHCHPEWASPLADWAGAPWRGPAPSCDFHVAVSRAIVERARAAEVTVLLSGFGGDSVVSWGLGYLAELVRQGRLVRVVAEARALGGRHGRAVWPLMRRYGLSPFVPEAVRRARGRVRGPAAQEVPVRRDVLAALGFDNRLAAAGSAEGRRARSDRDSHLHELAHGHIPWALEGSWAVDGAVGVERRYPFLDRRLAELCVSVPGDQKLRDGWTRSLPRRAMRGIVPDAVLQRPGKGDLTPGFLGGLLGADRPALEALVSGPLAVDEWVDRAALSALWQRCLAEPRPADGFALWRVAVLERWLHHHGLAG